MQGRSSEWNAGYKVSKDARSIELQTASALFAAAQQRSQEGASSETYWQSGKGKELEPAGISVRRLLEESR